MHDEYERKFQSTVTESKNALRALSSGVPERARKATGRERVNMP